ncbi:LytR/AlgR family response regulator transcription factor [Marinifilum flexuosum]|uniref:LytTR family two component transcriptional regulator n=1 Tax=Marinifilum flexuosum TaxID=1117708 RepID=A0A419X7Y2_9BACT|nr:LytTR family DNA-binding domain-containing protein [Marinifilum flexuosum]RKE03815.1 LytTR family two component transcriptional regulator [Marinifilum flexuosum]
MNQTTNKIYTCIIVEDEPLSQEILESYLQDCPQLKLKAICNDALEANQILLKEAIDLLFLDINMPKMNGIEWLKSLDQSPKVIFTTAYPEYAVEGFDLNALDYLLKPFSFERFLRSVNKFLSLQEKVGEKQENQEETILVKSNKKTYLLKPSELNYIESDGDYLKLHRKDDCLVIHDTLKHFQTKLPSNDFMRIHRSFIINLGKIDYLEGNQVCIAKQMVPIANSYIDQLMQLIKK